MNEIRTRDARTDQPAMPRHEIGDVDATDVAGEGFAVASPNVVEPR